MTSSRRGHLPKPRAEREHLTHAFIERESCLNSPTIDARVFPHLTFKEFAEHLLDELSDIEMTGIGVAAEGLPPRFERSVDKSSLAR
jgi:hypothetical protein